MADLLDADLNYRNEEAEDEFSDEAADEGMSALLESLFGVIAQHPESEPLLVGSYLTESAMQTAATAYHTAHPEADVFVRHNPDIDKFDVAELGADESVTDPSIGVAPGKPIADFADEELARAYIDQMTAAGIDTSTWRIGVADPWCTYVYAS